MNITLKRISDNGESTIGLMSVDGIKVFTIEDQAQAVKISGETRIPQGMYLIKLRKEGGRYNQNYYSKYGEDHKGMLWLQDVPNFTWVYIHPGNTDDDTEGCILPNMNAHIAEHTGSESKTAYWKIYPLIAEAIESGEEVNLCIIDSD